MSFVHKGLRPAVLVYLIVASVHLATLGFVAQVAQSRDQSLSDHLAGDIPGYIALANRMLDDGTFRNIDTGLPETFRTPGYPGFVAATFAVTGGSTTALLVLQTLLLSLVGVVVYAICRALLLSPQISAFTGIVSGLTPGMLGLTLGGVGGDILYTLLLLCAVYLPLSAIRRVSPRVIAVSIGVILGVATLIRPVGLYLIPLFGLGVAGFALARFELKKQALGLCLTTLVAASAVLLPWYMRNHVQTGHFMLTSLPAFNLTWYNIPAFLGHKNGTTDATERKKMLADLGNPPPHTLYSYTMTDALTEYDAAFFKEHLLSYLPFHAIKTIPFFVSSSLRDDTLVLQSMGVHVPLIPNNDNLTSLLLHGRVYELAIHLIDYWPFALESLSWAILFLLAFIAPYVAHDPRTRAVLLLGASIILVSGALTGPVAQARYRVPVEPYVWIGAMYTLTFIAQQRYSLLSKRRRG